jgi:microcystin-dependent protein
MGTPFLGEIKIVSFNFAPRGWALCNGQLLPINQNQALFSILGITYGGDGRVSFGLPDLQGRVPLHTGNGFVLGQRGGEEAHTLNIAELPAHVHVAQGNTTTGDAPSPVGNYWGNGNEPAYSTGQTNTNVAMNPAAIPIVGGSLPHLNLSPLLVLNFVIALQGIFPSQN